MTLDILELLVKPEMTKVCAPMVRYSKLQFRTLVRKYDCDICFTPMILADSFIQSSMARKSEFSTSPNDRPLIVQFAAKEVEDFVSATQLIAPYSNGVDLNCGCPQKWAMKDGYGSDLLTKPQLVKDLIYQVRNRIPKPFTVSVKIRILKDIKRSVELCKIIENAGASFLTVHARTPQMRNEPIDVENLKLLRSCVNLPMIANGNVKSLENAKKLFKETNCNGIMVASGILSNPAIFSGYLQTPVQCVQDWLDITFNMETSFLSMHHHLVFMLEKILNKSEKQIFNVLNNKSDVYDFLEKRFNIKPSTTTFNENKLTECKYQMIPKKIIEKTQVEDDFSIDFDNLFI